MTALAPIHAPGQDLPGLIERAASMLSGAKTAAEVLEAREAAGLAYDIAKRTARLQTAKSAHDDLVAAAHRAQADALEIEAAAKRRLADEYDAAQARGEVKRNGGWAAVLKTTTLPPPPILACAAPDPRGPSASRCRGRRSRHRAPHAG